MCHLYRLRIKTHVLTITMPCFIDSIIARQFKLQMTSSKGKELLYFLDYFFRDGWTILMRCYLVNYK